MYQKADLASYQYAREIDSNDIEDMIDMTLAFFDENGGKGQVASFFGEPDIDNLRTLFDNAIENPDAAFFVLDDGKDIYGFIGGFITNPFYNHSLRIALELGWWLRPEYRRAGLSMDLLGAFESWAEERGANQITMVCLESIMPEVVGKIYTDMGYRLTEHSYTKVI